MALQIGIVGLPNVGKSTLFNALVEACKAEASNYAFCTIDPNIGVVEVPDARLKKIVEIVKPKNVIPATVEFVDIAGLVEGAHKGEGLGNQFLANIRQVDAIAHVVRVFDDPNIMHVHGKILPKHDREVIETELIMADLKTVEKRLSKAESEAKSGDQKKKEYAALVLRLKEKLEQGILAIDAGFTDEERGELRDLFLMTSKPMLYVLNVSENAVRDFDEKKYRELLGVTERTVIVPLSAKIEAELQDLDETEKEEFLRDFGITERGLHRFIREAYRLLGLITYFTAGEKEARAWTVKKNATAPQAAGVIHTDFERGFISAEVISYDDFVEYSGEAGAKQHGKLRIEGKEYVVADGDVMHFRFNV